MGGLRAAAAAKEQRQTTKQTGVKTPTSFQSLLSSWTELEGPTTPRIGSTASALISE